MKRLFVFTYPKLTIYVIAIIAAYFVFKMQVIHDFVILLGPIFYLSVFLGGLLFSAGFTTPIATGFFLSIDPSNIYAAAIIAGFGALIADLGIFSFVKFSFKDEFNLLRRNSFIRHITSGVQSIFSKKIRKILVYILVIIIIASPLPDELGVALIAGFTKMHPYGFAIISFLGNSLGIFLLLLI